MDLSVVPNDLSPIHAIAITKTVLPTVSSAIGDPVLIQLDVAGVKDLIDDILHVENGVDSLEVREVLVLVGEHNSLHKSRVTDIGVEVPLLPSDLVVERVSVGLAGLKDLPEWLIDGASVPDNPLTVLQLLPCVIHISILTDLRILVEGPTWQLSRRSSSRSEVVVGHLLSK